MNKNTVAATAVDIYIYKSAFEGRIGE